LFSAHRSCKQIFAIENETETETVAGKTGEQGTATETAATDIHLPEVLFFIGFRVGREYGRGG